MRTKKGIIMLVYFGMFAVVALLTYIAQRLFEKEEDKNKKKIAIVLSIIIILIPSIVAGLRDTSIGTDVDKYVGPDFGYAVKSESIGAYFETSQEEPLYTLLNYIVSRFTTDVHWILFFVQLIMTTLVYLAIYQQRKKIPMWISMLIYLFLIYTRFLNLIRQGIAVCFIIFAFRYIEKQKLKPYLLIILIATLFHRTAILALPLYFIYWLVNQNNKRSKKLMIVMYILLIISVFYYDIFLELFLKINILPDKFQVYIDKFQKDSFDPNIFLTLYKGIWLVLVAIFYKELNKNDKNTKFFINLLVIDIILTQFSIKITYADRLTYYYGCIGQLFLIPQLPKVITVKNLEKLYFKLPNKKEKIYLRLPEKLRNDKLLEIIVKVIIVLLLVLYFYWCFIHYSAGEIYPYKSKILGI